MAEIDVELKKAFQEMQLKMQETKKKLRMADAQTEMHNQEIRRSQITKTELLSLPEDTPTYISIGRMFMKQNVSESVSYLEKTATEMEEKISSLKNNKALLEKSLKESESNLRDMVQARQATR